MSRPPSAVATWRAIVSCSAGRGPGIWEVRYVHRVTALGGNGDYSRFVEVTRVP